ncbi:MAG: rRNA pseudouridine synthase [Candidatus Cloacimonetes bacterium]|nr:rRNA pseudouridine synthase [Candidatus Cloacimonadota bacterium]MBL7148535.1 rRNA pseudouridine synthase [Candidatus Cloacimonadota bacterium]
MVRLNKYLAQCNMGSRRSVEALISNRRIKINGITTTDLSTIVDEEKDVVEVDDKILKRTSEKIYLMQNKPPKYVVTKKDELNRSTVYDLLPDFGVNIFSIGRLDYMSEGLLLFTNDGDFSEKIIHPRYKLPKLYKVKVKGNMNTIQLEQLRKGVKISGKVTQPAIVHVKRRTSEVTILRMTIFEGRKRQIRYMLKAIGSEVLELKRLQIGNLKLGKLPPGMWRMLKPTEIRSLLNYKEQRKK